ncbi:aminotransferase [Candidatus Marinamargulisbacteria bacterium SCGC AG-439-L15]|nr:aminotransferase [Candidatus Marinamargulisbacteria bacterium SCGC AG-439-L15]
MGFHDLKKELRLSKSVVAQEEKDLVSKVLDEGYLGMGTWVKTFEEDLSRYLDGVSVVAVNTGTSALHLALMAVGVGSGDEVLVPSLTYVASYQAISATGAIPVHCDVQLETAHIDLKDAQSRLTSKTKAIMTVDYAGNPCDYDAILFFAKENGLRVIHDSAHSFGSLYQGKKVGTFGDITCFSFDGIKNITSGEGGAVVSSDPKVIQYVKDSRLLGVQKDSDLRYQGQRSWEFDVSHQGYRYHMSNIMAAIGIAQLKKFESQFKPVRQKLAKLYVQEFQELLGITLFNHDYDVVVPHIFPIRVGGGRRDDLRAYLIDLGIACGIHYYPNHFLTYYKQKGLNLSVTEQLYSELLTLPLHPEISTEEVVIVCEKIRAFLS